MSMALNRNERDQIFVIGKRHAQFSEFLAQFTRLIQWDGTVGDHTGVPRKRTRHYWRPTLAASVRS